MGKAASGSAAAATGSVEPIGRVEFAQALANAGAISRHLPATEIARKSKAASAAIIGHSAAVHEDLVDVVRRAGKAPLYQLSKVGRAMLVADLREASKGQPCQ